MSEGAATESAEDPPASPLHSPIFRAVWMASLASSFGGLIQSVGASWMMMSLTNSPQMVALVQASTTLPIMLLSLWSGAVADNLDRRLVMLSAQIFMLVVSTGLAIFAWLHLLSPWPLLGFTFLIGCGMALHGPAWQASVGDMVPRAALPGAVALNSMAFNIARSVGPAIGGAIVAAVGAAGAFLTNSFSYIALIIVLARWRPHYPPRLLPRESLGLAMAAGVRYAAMSPNIRVVLVRAAAFGFAASAVPALMPLVARDLIGGGPLVYGILLGAFGMGAVSGALLSGAVRRALATEWIVRLASLTMAAGTAVVAVSGILPLTFIMLMLAGGGWLLALSTFNVTVQMSAPRWVVARGLALYQMAAFGGMAGGSWLFGSVADDHGVTNALLTAAIALVVTALIGLRIPLAQIEDQNLMPLSRWQEPETAVPIEPRSGPIVVTIEYRIAQKDVAAFLTEMSERRRIRRRDGALHWTLLRDLADPCVWVERYHVPTWLDYVRHNQRRTHADAHNSDRIMALHLGPEQPRVHRMIERQTGSLPATRTPGAREMAAAVTDPSGSA